MHTLADERDARVTEAAISYVSADSRVNRRYVAPGVECNTGRYEVHRVPMHENRRLQERFSLDVHGFVLAERPSAVMDFYDAGQVEQLYPAEVEATVKALTGASRVLLMSWMIRTSGELAEHRRETVGYSHKGGVQPPAGEAHVDFTPQCAERLARELYGKAFPDGQGYTRFIASSLWRTFWLRPRTRRLHSATPAVSGRTRASRTHCMWSTASRTNARCCVRSPARRRWWQPPSFPTARSIAGGISPG